MMVRTFTEFQDDGKLLVTVMTRWRKFWLFGPVVEEYRQYIGSCTVWYHFPSFRRCWTSTETWLSGIWTRTKAKK